MKVGFIEIPWKEEEKIYRNISQHKMKENAAIKLVYPMLKSKSLILRRKNNAIENNDKTTYGINVG